MKTRRHLVSRNFPIRKVPILAALVALLIPVLSGCAASDTSSAMTRTDRIVLHRGETAFVAPSKRKNYTCAGSAVLLCEGDTPRASRCGCGLLSNQPFF